MNVIELLVFVLLSAGLLAVGRFLSAIWGTVGWLIAGVPVATFWAWIVFCNLKRLFRSHRYQDSASPTEKRRSGCKTGLLDFIRRASLAQGHFPQTTYHPLRRRYDGDATRSFAARRMQQPRTSDNDLESKLAGFVRSYIHASRGGGATEAKEELRWVCAGLEYLLGSLLDGCDGWNGWVDGIIPATDMLPDAVQVSSDLDLTVRGQRIWGKKSGGPFWIEPFFGWVQITEERDAVAGYEIDFGDAGRGLGECPYGKHIRLAEWYSPRAWLFAFSKAL